MSEFSRRGFLKGGLASAAGAVLLKNLTPAQAKAATKANGDGAQRLTIKTRVNGDIRALKAGADDLALDALRLDLGLTGCKRGCGHGACGACTILVDGVPQVSCLLPTVALHDHDVTTVEAMGAEGLHPVQRAFMAEDALQCGYCTPGFVVEAVAFHDAWRAQHPGQEPSREAVADAMAGHLCRCGAYQSIYKAIQGACAGRFDGDDTVAARVDALPKVTGAAKYTVDIRQPGQLEGRLFRSPHAHARLTRLDPSAALALKGVKAFVRFLDDGGLISYAGQELGAIAAVDAHTAREALTLIKAEYALLTPVASTEQSRSPNAPIIFNTKKPDKMVANSSEGFLLAAHWEGNVRGPVSASTFAKPKKARGRIDAAVAAGGHVVEEIYTSHTQVHTTLEPHAAVAHWQGSNKLTVWASTQSCAGLAEDIAERYELDHGDVQVLCDFVGAGFGSKAGFQMESRAAIDLAREAGAPVRVALSRQEEITVGGLRPGEEIHLTVGAHANGSQAAMVSRAYAHGGVGVGNSTGLMFRICYPSESKDLQDFDVITNTPPGKPFRGPGGPQACFALEQALDELAQKMGKSPVALRREWDVNPGRLKLYDWVEALPAWRDRGELPRSGRFRRGVGLASAGWFVFHSVHGQLRLDASPAGFSVTSACQDMGNGSKSVVAYEIADVLGLNPTDIQVNFGDSHGPRGPLSAGSRTTLTLAPVARELAEKVRDELVEMAEADLGYEGAQAAKGGIQHAGGVTSWAELLQGVQPITMTGKRGKDPGGYFLPFAVANMRVGKRSAGAVQLSLVEVDTRLGRVKVLDTWIGLSVGRIVAPKVALSQVEGGVIQGVSYALYEDRRIDPVSARTLTVNLEDYRIAGLGDVPNVHVHFDDEPWEAHLGGGVGLSELATVPCAASIANAVYDATGFRPRAMPLRPDVILGGLS